MLDALHRSRAGRMHRHTRDAILPKVRLREKKFTAPLSSISRRSHDGDNRSKPTVWYYNIKNQIGSFSPRIGDLLAIAFNLWVWLMCVIDLSMVVSNQIRLSTSSALAEK